MQWCTCAFQPLTWEVFMCNGVIRVRNSTIYSRNRSQPPLIPWCNGFLYNNGLIWSSTQHSHRCACMCGHLRILCMCVCVHAPLCVSIGDKLFMSHIIYGGFSGNSAICVLCVFLLPTSDIFSSWYKFASSCRHFALTLNP